MFDLLRNECAQFEMTIFELADALSNLEVWGLEHRYYETDLTESVKLKSELLSSVTRCAKLTKIYKQLINLELVNEKREYILYVANPAAPEDEWEVITFTRQSPHLFLIETY